MNKSMVVRTLGVVFLVMSAVMILPIITAFIYSEEVWTSFLYTGLISLGLGALCMSVKPKSNRIFSREGFAITGLSWICISIVGALPFLISGEIPSVVDAIFETASGFTTTGASILSDLDSMSKSILFWREFTHWLGGMGVLVFIMALIPSLSENQNMHIMKAESPGPVVGKLRPRLRSTPMILYGIYTGLTALEVILLMLGKMPFYDALLNSFGTAGTGGFGFTNAGMSKYSMYCQGVISVFMMLFGINFNAYFLILGKKIKDAFKMEEVRWYLFIVFFCTFVVTFNIRSFYPTLFECFHHSYFQVLTVMTTTGYSTANFDLWPELSKTIMLTLMFIGACAGSTGGGIKVSRIMIVVKHAFKELSVLIHPRRVKVVKMDGKKVDPKTYANVNAYLLVYALVFVASLLIVALDNYDFITNFSAVAATLNNIGPGFNLVGATCNYGFLSNTSKLVLTFDMIAGRLELFPLIILFAPGAWKR